MRQLEKVCCPFCRHNESKVWLEENGYTAVKCKSCGFVYVNPRPLLSSIDEAAQTGLHEIERGKMSVVGRFRKDKVRFYHKRLLELYPDETLARQRVSWLDVGTGFGELLLAIKEIADKESIIQGIEPCKPKAEKAVRLGLNVTSKSLSELDQTYDYISLINVFSHLPEPVDFFSELRQHLNRNGEIVLVTGNGGDIPVEDYPTPHDLPDHLVFAGEKHITAIFEQLGFQVLKVNRYSEFLPENKAFLWMKNRIKVAMGRSPRLIQKNGAWRCLFVRAKLMN